MIIHPVYLTDPREAASAHLRTAIVDGCASQAAVHLFLCGLWHDPVVAFALYKIWSARRRHSLDHATIAEEMPHARTA